MFTIDAHLDLSMNAMEWNRDLRLPVQDIRRREAGMNDKPDRGKSVVSLPELRRGEIGLVVATQIARYAGEGNPLPGWRSPEQAWAQTQAQLAWYREMEARGEMVMIKDLADLNQHVNQHHDNDNLNHPTGYILSLEGADSLVDIRYIETAYAYGLRALGPAHYGEGRYANGTDAHGRLNKDGCSLIKEMDRLDIILDVTHLCDDAFWHALDIFKGHVWASHSNCRSLVDHNRQLSDEMIKALVERNAVIGVALDAWMLVPGWQRQISTPEALHCNLASVVNHIDHICNLTGNSLHVAIGSDLDGAFGKEQCPYDIDTIADLQKLPALLRARGYSEHDIINIMHANWLRTIKEAWA